ncbi:MAG: hypothetical protein HYV07_00140 [Deltaproteobacteria bacterium]|nr:hypothetical protein [Deltaproteobacteria bacterium]
MTAALLARARDLLGPIPDDVLIKTLLGVGVAAIDLTLSGRLSDLSGELETLIGIAISHASQRVRR